MDVTAWLIWFLECLDHAFDRAEGTLAQVLAKARFWERLGSKAGAAFNGRQSLWSIAFLTASKASSRLPSGRQLPSVHKDTALRDIEDLVRRGVLRKESAGGRSTSYALILT